MTSQSIWSLPFYIKNKFSVFYLPINLQYNELFTSISSLYFDNMTNPFKLERNGITVNVREIYAQLNFTNIVVNFTLYNVMENSIFSGLEKGFPFALNMTHYSMNLVYQLKLQGYTDKLIITFDPFNNISYFGDIPYKVIYQKHQYKWKINPAINSWGIQMSQIYITNNKDSVLYNLGLENFLYFQTIEERVYFPSQFINFLKNEVFADYIKSSQCLYSNSTSLHYFTCYYTQTIKDYKINFILGNMLITFKLEEIMGIISDDESNFKSFTLRENPHGYWAIGVMFLRKFVSVFDYENKEIILFSDQEFKLVGINHKANSIRIKFLLFLIIVDLLGICLIWRIKFKFKV